MVSGQLDCRLVRAEAMVELTQSRRASPIFTRLAGAGQSAILRKQGVDGTMLWSRTLGPLVGPFRGLADRTGAPFVAGFLFDDEPAPALAIVKLSPDGTSL